MEISTAAPAARRTHPALWFAGALAFVVLSSRRRGLHDGAHAEQADAAAGMSAPESHAAAPGAEFTHADAGAPRRQRLRRWPQPPPRPRASCVQCGVVEAVTPVRHKGEGTGVGAGRRWRARRRRRAQMGGGRGKDAMTVIGAVGGGVAGHEVEARPRDDALPDQGAHGRARAR
ncbi:MAG: hypothetical protein U1F25_10980 [Rubrivivax sp.]